MWNRNWLIRTSTLLVLGLGSYWPAAHGVLPDTELGIWFKSQATPHLLEVIGKHPRFKGERLSVVTMQNRKPATQGHQLGHSLAEYATHRLLSQSQASITWREQHGDCRPTRPTPYLLGIEVKTLTRQRAAVTIAVVDVEENIWVPGTSLQWQGRLSSAERRALQQTVSRAADGSVGRPIALSRQQQIKERLLAQLHCAMPAGIDGKIFVSTPAETDEQLGELGNQLTASLQRSPLFELANDLESATWLAVLRIKNGSNPRLELMLTEADGRGEQRLAALHVSTDAQSAPTRRTHTNPAKPGVRDAASNNVPLLTAIEEIDVAPCPKNSQRQCLQLELALQRSAWLVTFRSHAGSISGQSCNGSIQRSEPANKRYRIMLPEDETVGFYALATAHSQVARKLAKILARAPGTCNRSATRSSAWLAQLTDFLHKHEERIHWRATHLSNEAEMAVAER